LRSRVASAMASWVACRVWSGADPDASRLVFERLRDGTSGRRPVAVLLAAAAGSGVDEALSALPESFDPLSVDPPEGSER